MRKLFKWALLALALVTPHAAFAGMDGDAQALAIAKSANTPKVICASSAPVRAYGLSTTTTITSQPCTIKGGTFKPGQILEFKALLSAVTTPAANKSIQVLFGSTVVWQASPVATVLSLNALASGFITPDLQNICVHSPFMNAVNAPDPAAFGTLGAPYSVSSSAAQTCTAIDFTQDQALTVKFTPKNNDIVELAGWSLVATQQTSVTNTAPSTAFATFSNSLGTDTGSLGTLIKTPTGDTTSGSNTIASLSSTSGLAAGQVITGSCLPTDGVSITGISGSSATLDQNAITTTTGCALKIFSGAWPVQLGVNSPGRVWFDNSVGGTTEAQIAARQKLDVVRGVYWTQLGGDQCRNDVGTVDFQANCLAGIAAQVSRLAPGVKYAYSTTIPAANENVGGANWNAIVATNTAQIALLGSSHIVDTGSILTSAYTVNIPLKYRLRTATTTGTCTASSTTLTVASATGIVNGQYVLSPGSAVIDAGLTSTAPTVVSGGGTTTLTLSAACGAGGLSGAMVSFIGTSEVHLNDLGYYVGYTKPYLDWLTANGG